jgi:tripartite-type tricarboxylate transporter receptor subunit TctC
MKPARLFAASFAAMTLALACGAAAQSYPSKPITIIVPFPPGGIHDVYTRWVGNALHQRLGQPIVIENRPGAGSWVGIQALAKAAPDGHTLFSAGHVVGFVSVFVKGASFEPGKDFVPLTGVLYAPFVIISTAQLPAKTLPELLAYAKANPGKLNFGYVPNGGNHLNTLEFIARTGGNMVPVPYQGGAPALRAVLANEAQIYLGAALGLEQNVKAGKINALAVTSATRFAPIPDVPTVRESTGMDFDRGVLYAMYASPGTPRPIADRLHKEIVDIVQNTEVNALIRKQGYEPATTTPEALAELILREIRTGREVARANNIQPQ